MPTQYWHVPAILKLSSLQFITELWLQNQRASNVVDLTFHWCKLIPNYMIRWFFSKPMTIVIIFNMEYIYFANQSPLTDQQLFVPLSISKQCWVHFNIHGKRYPPIVSVIWTSGGNASAVTLLDISFIFHLLSLVSSQHQS